MDHGGRDAGGAGAGTPTGRGGGNVTDSMVLNPLDAELRPQHECNVDEGDMETMLAMMKRKSISPDEVKKLQALMMKQKNEGREE